MKGKITWFTFLVLAFSTAAHVFAADAEIPSTGYPIKIDGVMDIAWPGAAPRQVANVVQGAASPTGCSGSWRALWDPQYLYVFIDVNDDALYHDNPVAEDYQDDGVEVFIDIHNNKATSYGTDDYQYRFNWDATTPVINFQHGTTTDGIDFAIVTTDTGYTCEARFPWTLLYQNQGGPSVGDLMGFEVQVNDDDNGGARDNQLDWYTTENNTWQNPSLMGTVELVQGAAPVNASNPKPSNEAQGVWADAVLTWISGMYADQHDVYFGTALDEVSTATRSAPAGVLLSQGQTATDFDPPGLLDFGQTYYWRVDEVNAPSAGGTIFKGDVWGFTVEPYSYPITPAAATASSSMGDKMKAANTIGNVGLDPATDQHSIEITTMWVSSKAGPQPTWIQYDFDRVLKLDQMWVWNSNQALEELLGYGVKQAKVEVSADGTTWTEVPNVPEFAQATGQIDYVHNTTVDLGGAVAQHVRLTCLSTWGGGSIYSLSEVRFFQAPTRAYGPQPESGAANVAADVLLNWRPGRDAVRHEVYLGTDPNALALAQTVTDHQVALGGQYGQTYYWRVDEVNDAATPASWEGDVWSLSTSVYKVVDDFESYNGQCKRIFFSWKDGLGYSDTPDCGVTAYGGNGTGSAVGNADPPYVERSIVHGGQQAMPLSYDNTSGSGVSEAVLTFSPAQDWTAGGLKTLVLFFRGDLANGAGQLYLKINGTNVSYNGNAADLTNGLWNQWNVDLSGLSVKAVSSLTIGVSGTGKGVLYVDDIRLYREAPAVVVPSDPGQIGLVAWYSMEGSVQDGSGNGNNGTVGGTPTYETGRTGLGTALGLNGVSDCVDLGNKAAFNPAGSLGISLWANIGAWGTAWNHVMVGNRGESNVGWQVRRHSSTSLCFTTRGVGQDDTASVLVPPVNEWIHITCVYDHVANTKTIYVNGIPDTVVTTNAGAKVAATTHNTYIGARAVGGNTGPEAFFTGMLDDIRIYNRALSEAEARYLAGDR